MESYWYYRKQEPVKVLFYCEHPVDAAWIRSTHDELRKAGVSVGLAISQTDYYLADWPRSQQYLVSKHALKFLDCELLVTASSNISRSVMPPKSIKVHMPHSLLSLHVGYPYKAFDGFDYLLTCGKHHQQEIEAMHRIWPSFTACGIPVGYGKNDVLIAARQALPKTSGLPHIFIAPSWGQQNILETMGITLTEALLAQGYRVTIRPHPVFWIHANRICSELITHFGHHPAFRLENSTLSSNLSFLTADLLISDYSSVAYEYIFVSERPVVFVDVPKKVLNPYWRELNLEPVEHKLRSELGKVVLPQIEEVLAAIKVLLQDSSLWLKPIRHAREKYCINHGQCGVNAAETIQTLLK